MKRMAAFRFAWLGVDAILTVRDGSAHAEPLSERAQAL